MSPSTATKTDSLYEVSGTETPIAQPYRPHLRGTGGAATQVFGVLIFADVPLYQDDLPERFQQLVIKWTNETLYTSSIQDMVSNPSYLRIVAMGDRAIPLILRELEKSPNYWFHALMALTEEDPIPEEARGRLTEMTEAWLKWGHENNFLF